MALELAVPRAHLRDGTRRRPHAHGNARPLERWPRRGGRAQHALTVAHHDFTIRPQVNQDRHFVTLVQLGRQQPRQDVAAHKAPQARQETHRRITRKLPAELRRLKHLQTRRHRLEGIPRKRLQADAAE